MTSPPYDWDEWHCPVCGWGQWRIRCRCGMEDRLCSRCSAWSHRGDDGTVVPGQGH